MKAKHLFLIILACVLASCGGGRKLSGPFEVWERTVITMSDSVMYVNVVSDFEDSLSLRAPSRDLSDEELQSDLYTMLAHKMLCTVQSPQQDGVGLAAPQVGILRRIAVVDVTADHSGLKELINPEIIERSGSQTGREGCLSVPERQGVVTRPMKIRVRYQDRKGNYVETEAEGLEARAICHETDHLDGILYVDIMDRELSQEEIEGRIPEDGE
jgi:peptide deformylase